MNQITLKCPYCMADAVMLSDSDYQDTHTLHCSNKDCDGNGTVWYCQEDKNYTYKERIKSTINKYKDVIKRLAKR